VAAGGLLKTLRVHLGPLAELGADTLLEFEVLDAARRVLKRDAAVPGSLPRLPRTELVVAAPDVLLLDATLPRLSGARLRAALPAAAEPMVLGDIEQMFVAAGKVDAEGRATLAVLDRALLRRALELFARLNLQPVSATPEPLTLDWRAGRWRLRDRGRYSCLRTGERSGICCSPLQSAEPPVELRLMLAQNRAAKPEAIEVEGECDTAAWSAALGVPVVAAEAGSNKAMSVALELLQYEFARRMIDWRTWRTPAALAAALVLVWIAGLNVEAWLMLREERELRGHLAAVLREAFPRVTVVLDPLAQMRQALGAARSGAGMSDAEDFLVLAANFAQLAQQDADAVRALEYRERTLLVRFDPRAFSSKTRREALLERLAQAGLAGAFSAEATLSVRRRSAS
jgi:general secretion pathway protein L